jgi:hypothetical protein
MKEYENYPIWMVAMSNALSLSIYAIGALIMLGFGILFAALYLVYCAFVEFNVLRRSCVNCYYYGKVCCFGKGKVCSHIFKRGNAKSFVNRNVSPKDLLPDFLVSIIPIIGSIITLVTAFSWTVLFLLIVLAVLTFSGNALIRGSFACKYCKQRKIGCPAEKMFRKR